MPGMDFVRRKLYKSHNKRAKMTSALQLPKISSHKNQPKPLKRKKIVLEKIFIQKVEIVFFLQRVDSGIDLS